MKEFINLELCDDSREDLNVHVTASLKNGCLSISGQDIGKSVSEIWGDSDYEYFYELNEEGTQNLLQLIHGTDDPETAVLNQFQGLDGCANFRKICDDNGISYRFFSYI